MEIQNPEEVKEMFEKYKDLNLVRRSGFWFTSDHNPCLLDAIFDEIASLQKKVRMLEWQAAMATDSIIDLRKKLDKLQPPPLVP